MSSTSGDSHVARTQYGSVFEAIMADPQSRHAYYNTTRGLLAGNPDQAETQGLRSDLCARAVAHLFSPDESLPRPVFYSAGAISIGADEIVAATSSRLVHLTT